MEMGWWERETRRERKTDEEGPTPHVRGRQHRRLPRAANTLVPPLRSPKKLKPFTGSSRSNFKPFVDQSSCMTFETMYT